MATKETRQPRSGEGGRAAVGPGAAAGAAASGVDERRETIARRNEANERRAAEAQPTPTQAENDLAKVGALDIDNKEDDGSGPDIDRRLNNLEHLTDEERAQYATREAEARERSQREANERAQAAAQATRTAPQPASTQQPGGAPQGTSTKR